MQSTSATAPPTPTATSLSQLHQSRYLEILRLTKSFPSPGSAPVCVVRDFSFISGQGEFTCLIGHSGCGKSTVLSMVAGLSDPTSGGIVVEDREVRGTGLDRAMVFQSPCLLPWMTALGNVMLSVDRVRGGLPRREREAIAAALLERVGLADGLHKRPRELSAGMKQRVGLARALALDPKVLLLDEPFGSLDCITRMELQEVLLDIWERQRITALMVTHDVDEALFLADRVVMMTNGPEARVGDVVEVPFPRPRRREDLLNDPEYYALRERLIGFLEEQEQHREKAAPRAKDEGGRLELATNGSTRVPIAALSAEGAG